MNEEHSPNPAPAPGSPRKRTIAVAAGVGVAGLLAGGLAAGAISAASADSGDVTGRGGYGGVRGYGGPGAQGGDPSKPMRDDEKLLTGSTRTKVLAAVKAKYPDAEVQRVETDSDGVYEAHILNDGTPLTVLVGKDFAVTGTESGPAGGPGGHGHDGPGGSEQREGQPPAPPTTEDSAYRQS
jgi:hypothetical protein